jgi:hypothetical protein
MLKRIAFAFILSVVVLIQIHSRIAHPQSPGHRGSILDIFKAKHYYVPHSVKLKKYAFIS